MFEFDLEVLFEFGWLDCGVLLFVYIWFKGSFCLDDLVERLGFGDGGVRDCEFSRNLLSFLVFGTGGDVGLVGGVGGGVRCRLCLGIFGCGCITGCGAGVLIV